MTILTDSQVEALAFAVAAGTISQAQRDNAVAASDAAKAAIAQERIAKGEAILAAEEERAKNVRLGRALLREEQGFSDFEVDSLSSLDVLRMSGIVPDATPPDDTLATNLAALSEDDRAFAAQNGIA